MVAGFHGISSRFMWLKLRCYRPLVKLEKAFAREVLFAGYREERSELLQCPFLVAFAVASDMSDGSLHTLRFCKVSQLLSCQVVHETVIVRVRFRRTA